jgi:hypothetical protein
MLAAVEQLVNPLVMVVNSYRQHFFRLVLPHHPLIQLGVYFFGRQGALLVEVGRCWAGTILLQDSLAQIYALITDKDLIRPGNEPVYFILGAFAERANLNLGTKSASHRRLMSYSAKFVRRLSLVTGQHRPVTRDI